MHPALRTPICDLLGMPAVDRDEFRRRGAARFDLTAGSARLFDTAAGTRQFLIDLVTAERRSPHQTCWRRKGP